MSGYDKQLILIIFAVFNFKKVKTVTHFQDFQGLQPKFKDFPAPGIFFCQLFHDRSRIFKDRGTSVTCPKLKVERASLPAFSPQTRLAVKVKSLQ